MEKEIIIKGARVNNLKSVDLKIPINKLTCISGPSGSGKSSLAFHTLFAESKRRFLNSFPTYLKFFSDRPAPVDVDLIEPVLPVFGLPQINPVVGTRSTVADTMHLTELLQNLFYMSSEEVCPYHKVLLERSSISQSVAKQYNKLSENDVLYFLTPREDFITFLKDSPFPNRSLDKIENKIRTFEKDDELWELVRIKFKNIDSLDKKLKPYFDKKVPVLIFDGRSVSGLNSDLSIACPNGDYIGSISKQLSLFSPYNALGACEECNGFGANLVYDENKLLRKELSIRDGGAKFLEYKRFGSLIEDLKKEMKKQGYSLDKPIGKLPKKFMTLLYEGAGVWCGLNELFEYLESKKYKASVRIFIRGIQKEEECLTCGGSRLNTKVHNYYLFEKFDLSYKDSWQLTIVELHNFLKKSRAKLLNKNDSNKKILNQIINLLDVANGIGLGHLKINRKSKSVSAGEYQRLLLLKYLSYEGTGSLFIFDEPSLGLSRKELKILQNGLYKLIESGNTIVLVEHNKFFHEHSDYFISMGPNAGKFGGEVLYQGKYEKFPQKNSVGKIEKPKVITSKRDWVKIEGASLYNKTYKEIKFPSGEIIQVIGDSGSGKSSVFVNTFANKLNHDLTGEPLNVKVGDYKKISYPKNIENVIVVDANLNRYSSRSTVGSLTGLFTTVRKHFLNTPFAKSMGLKEGHLSANSNLGQCPSCEGKGVKIVEMQFLEDIILKCEDCDGKKIKPIYATLSDGSVTVYEAFSTPLSSIIPEVKLTPKFRRIWEYMKILNLDYLSLDRTVSSLSGGEKQRLYLLSKLEKEVKNSVLIFENISFGLSDLELAKMSEFFKELIKLNNTIIIIDQDEFLGQLATYTVNM